jgi:hypothetical protein
MVKICMCQICGKMKDYRKKITTNDWLIGPIYCLTSHSKIFHWYGDVTIAGEGLQNLGICSALRAFEHEGIFIVPHLLCHGLTGPRFFRSHPKNRSIQSPLTTQEGMWCIYSNPDPHKCCRMITNILDMIDLVISVISRFTLIELLFYVSLKNFSLMETSPLPVI